MSETLAAVRKLIAAGEVRISEHGCDELAADRISVREILGGADQAQLVEDYPSFPKGPTVLVLQLDSNRQPIHVVWGMPQGCSSPAVLVTAYRPDLKLWNEDFLKRRK